MISMAKIINPLKQDGQLQWELNTEKGIYKLFNVIIDSQKYMIEINQYSPPKEYPENSKEIKEKRIQCPLEKLIYDTELFIQKLVGPTTISPQIYRIEFVLRFLDGKFLNMSRYKEGRNTPGYLLEEFYDLSQAKNRLKNILKIDFERNKKTFFVETNLPDNVKKSINDLLI